jgi:di/tricarboxylate transporter
LSLHAIGIAGLVIVFLIGTLRPINLGVVALAMTFLVGTFVAGDNMQQMASGLPVDLLILLAGITYLFGVALENGTVNSIVQAATSAFGQRSALAPWVMFVLASLPAMAGALGSAGVAMLAPIALRLAKRYDIDRTLMGLMVIYGAGAGNFSPLNVLGALVAQTAQRSGVELSTTALFLANVLYNTVLAAIAYVAFGGLRIAPAAGQLEKDGPADAVWRIDRVCTVAALLLVAIAAFAFRLNVGFLGFVAGMMLQLAFPKSSGEPERKIAWSVVLLVCGIITYVAALQRYGTVDAVGGAIALLPSPLLAALLLCAVGAVTSAFASSAGILGAMIPLAAPFILRGTVDSSGLIIAVAVSATVVDAMPFSTVGALIVANAEDQERVRVYRGLIRWGVAMVITAPVLTWLLFVVTTS